jgi:outer membrane protein assembly factor BamE (lipoprotein component of BamABCDE complex)
MTRMVQATKGNMPGPARMVGRAGARLRFGLACLGLVALVACAPVYRNHGYVPAPDELALVEVGVDTRETVAEKVGRPSTSGLLNDVGWFYVQSRYKNVGPREPQEVDRQVLAITFTEAGVVENISTFGLEDGQVVQISRRVTESNIKGIGFIRQLLGSLGKIRAEDTGI